MNRQNFIVHLGIAVILVIVAAVAGQIRRWEKEGFHSDTAVKKSTPKPRAVSRSATDKEPEVLVKFRPEVSFDEIKKIAAKNNDNIEDEIEAVKKLVAIDDMDGQTAESVAAQYRNMPDMVLYAEPLIEIQASPLLDLKTVAAKEPVTGTAGGPNDPLFTDQWALNNTGQNGGKQKADIDALKAWQKTKGSDKVVVAVLDTGVDYTHPDLIGNMWLRPDNIPAYKDDELGAVNDLHGFNAVDNIRDPMDDNGHGTHCAGIIGAEGDNSEGIAGINWEVEIMPLKFLSRSGSGTTKDAIEAINYAIERKRAGVNVRVINASWGSTARSQALEDVIRAANEEGILFVAAAGNDGSSNDTRPHYPSNYPNVISVAASDRSDVMAAFSNFGVKSVHIAAPGKDIISTWLGGEYREASGTSMATPQVAGVAALLLSQDPKMSVLKLRERLLKCFDPVDSLVGKLENAGRINAGKVLGD